MTTSPRDVLALVGAVAVLASCGVATDAASAGSVPSSETSTLTVLTGRAAGMDDVAKEFTVVDVNAAGCVRATIPTLGGTVTGVLVAPEGSRVVGSASRPRVELPDGRTMDQESPLEGGGVALSADDLQGMHPDDADLVARAQAECQSDRVVVVDG